MMGKPATEVHTTRSTGLAASHVTRDAETFLIRQDGWDYRVATAASYLVNPLILPPILFGLVLSHYGIPVAEVGATVLMATVFFGLFPLLYVGLLLRRNEVDSIDMPIRQNRNRPYAVTILCSFAAAIPAFFIVPSAATLVAALVLCYGLNTTVAALINLRWKISIHLLSTSGFLSFLTFIAYPPFPTTAPLQPFLSAGLLTFVALLIPLLMWARVRVGAHTPGQVVAGTVCGLVIPYVELFLLYRTGILPGF